MWQCPYCGKEDRVVRAGRNDSGSQRLICKDCGKKFTPQPQMNYYPDEIHLDAVKLYLSGLSFRAVALQLGVNHQSVINWVNEYAMQLPRPKGRSLTHR